MLAFPLTLRFLFTGEDPPLLTTAEDRTGHDHALAPTPLVSTTDFTRGVHLALFQERFISTRGVRYISSAIIS